MPFHGLQTVLRLSLLLAVSGIPTPAVGATLDQGVMTEAIRYLGLVRGEEIGPDDAAWLVEQWESEASQTPVTVAEQVDELAAAFEEQERRPDPLALANARVRWIKNVYCGAAQSSDPDVHRLRDLLAPANLILAADCPLGLVVTRFDVDGLSASHALTAAVTGQSHDVGRDQIDIVGIIESGFKEAAPAEKALIAQGELRHALLARFWSKIDGGAGQRAVVDELRATASSDLRGAARQLESLAAAKLADVDDLAKAGEARLTAGMVNDYRQWLERIAGYGFSARDRVWLRQAIIDAFLEDPSTMLGEFAGIQETNRIYTRTDAPEARAELVAGWAANLHCYFQQSSDPDERQLAYIVFREDPVIDEDCQTPWVSRESDRVLAEAGGERLTERHLNLSLDFARAILGRPLLPDEEAVIREDTVQTFDRDFESWRENQTFYTNFLTKVGKYSENRFLAMDERQKLFDPIYCSLKTGDEPFADDYLKMFQRGGSILFEDCSQNLVTTKEEVDAVISFSNFLNMMNGREPFSAADADAIREAVRTRDLSGAEATMLALNEWWSLLTLEEKAAARQKIRDDGITPDAGGDTVGAFVNLVKLQVVTKNASLNMCRLASIVSQGNAAIFAAKAGRTVWNDRENELAGFPTRDYANMVSSNSLFAELCGPSNSG